MRQSRELPKGFEPLEEFVEQWVLPDSQARCEKRLSTSFEEIRLFYESMLEYAEYALEHLRTKQLGSLSQAEERLLKMMLALAEVGPVVEWYGEHEVTDGFDPRRFRLIQQLPDNAMQGGVI